MRHVVLHEVGHWFGVPHADVAGQDAMHDVMSKDYSKGELCVSSNSLVMLNNASDLRWEYRTRGGGGALVTP